jgi:hypothetical protein
MNDHFMGECMDLNHGRHNESFQSIEVGYRRLIIGLWIVASVGFMAGFCLARCL